jgi:hypothetical protein
LRDLSAAVGDGGKVVALDVEAAMVAHTRKHASWQLASAIVKAVRR